MKKPFYKLLYIQVIFAIVCGIILGVMQPDFGVDLKPLGDGFINLIKMIIAPVIFCTVVSGIAGMQDMKKVGRVGGIALIYFEIVSTIALFVGLLAADIMRPGEGFNADLSSIDMSSIAQYTTQVHMPTMVEFFMNIIPKTMISAFVHGEILQVLLVAVLFGVALAILGEKGKTVLHLIDEITKVIFEIVDMIMKVAPIGAFGAMAFTIGKYGLASLLPLAKLIGSFYLTCFLFVVVAFGQKR